MNDGTLLYSSVFSLCWKKRKESIRRGRQQREGEEGGGRRRGGRREKKERREKREMVGRNGKNKHVVLSLAFHTAYKQKKLAKCVSLGTRLSELDCILNI